MAFVPVAIGVGGFAAGYVTSQYMTPTGTPEKDTPEPLKDKKEGEKPKAIPQSMAEELKEFDKKMLTKVDVSVLKPYRSPSLIEDIRNQLEERRVSITDKKKKIE